MASAGIFGFLTAVASVVLFIQLSTVIILINYNYSIFEITYNLYELIKLLCTIIFDKKEKSKIS